MICSVLPRLRFEGGCVCVCDLVLNDDLPRSRELKPMKKNKRTKNIEQTKKKKYIKKGTETTG